MTKRNMTKAHCKARTASGAPCRMAALRGSDFCFNHDPSAAIERAKARRKGGENRHAPHGAIAPDVIPAEVVTIADAGKILQYTLGELLAMDNSIPRARALIATATAYIDAIKTGELEAQLKELLAVLQAREK